MNDSKPTRRSTPFWVFGILLISYAFFWHSRDWNSASRLMLTYAIVDRGTIVLDGLDEQTRDIARFRGRYYTDKLPGFSLLGVVPYALAKVVVGLPDHPLDVPGMTHWPADYWVTLGTSGLATAAAGAILVVLATRLGCGPRRSVLIGLAYGLATPAYVYATLSYGHQVTAFALLAAFALMSTEGRERAMVRSGLAGFLAAYAAVVELQVGPVSALLGFYLVGLVLGRKLPAKAIGAFALGALVPTLVLLAYNVLAFGSPFDAGYFHHAHPQFREVHSRDNPLGMGTPAWGRALDLVWGGHRGLLFYAPILMLAPVGWGILTYRKFWGTALVSFLICGVVFLVNLSYPEWSGGWSTGPRLLVPLLPFAMIPVAGILAVGGRGWTVLAVLLALAGGCLMLLFQGVGGRVPQDILDPLRTAVWPLWRGDPVPFWATAGRFDRNGVSVFLGEMLERLPSHWQWVQFVPLLVVQGLAIGALYWSLGRVPKRSG